MWISGAEHELTDNIVNLVLAKIPGGPPGTKGISLFIVPKFLVDADGSVGERNDVVLAGLNHKMGQRGITNTVLSFGDGTYSPGGKPGAVGYLVGEPHRGLAYMFHDDERGAARRRDGRGVAGLHGLPASAGVRPGASAGPPGDRQGPGGSAGPDHRARRCQANAAGAEGLCRGRPGAACCTAPAGRPAAQRRVRRRARPCRRCCWTS